MAKKKIGKSAPVRPSRGLQAAHKQLERSLILDVVEESLSAASGTKAYGFENIRAVGISEKIVNGWLTADTADHQLRAVRRSMDQWITDVPEKE
jgi:hypothetical protein